jgi:hypothetical protein
MHAQIYLHFVPLMPGCSTDLSNQCRILLEQGLTLLHVDDSIATQWPYSLLNESDQVHDSQTVFDSMWEYICFEGNHGVLEYIAKVDVLKIRLQLSAAIVSAVLNTVNADPKWCNGSRLWRVVNVLFVLQDSWACSCILIALTAHLKQPYQSQVI